MLRLVDYSDDYYNALSNLQVLPSQSCFVCSGKAMLEKLGEDSRKNRLYMVLFGDITYGAVLLKEYKEHEFFIWQMLIDQRHQDNGVGKTTLRELIQKLKAQGATKLTTTIVKDNVKSLSFFEGFGFKYQDEIDNEVNLVAEIYYE